MSTAPDADSSSTSAVTYTQLTHVRNALSKLTCAEARAMISAYRRGHHNKLSESASSSSATTPRKMLSISTTETPMAAFRKLIEHGVQSAPVIDATTNKITGMLDLRDLVSLVVLMEEDALGQPQTRSNPDAPHLEAAGLASPVAPAPGSSSPSLKASSPASALVPPATASPSASRTSSPQRARRLSGGSLHPNLSAPSGGSSLAGASPSSSSSSAYLGLVFSSFSANTRAVDHRPQDYSVRYLAARNRCVTASASDSLINVIDVLGGGQDVHRVVVLDEKKEVVDIFSPSDIVKLLAIMYSKAVLPGHEEDKTDDACKQLKASVAELHIGSSPVLSVVISQSMFKTLALMSANKITGVAVVDDDGKLVSNTSGADLKLYLQHPSSRMLHLAVLDFLSEVRRASTNDVAPAVAFNEEASVLAVIAKLAATKMHRVFIVDNNSRPIAVISVEDIVRLLHRGAPSRRVDRVFHKAQASASAPSGRIGVTTLSGHAITSSPRASPKLQAKNASPMLQPRRPSIVVTPADETEESASTAGTATEASTKAPQ